ncbi:MAG: 4Fe-4S binding protein [Chloroflexota bacterium]|nr:4Fe-4S binding protein [Chloroflexota bacterium]
MAKGEIEISEVHCRGCGYCQMFCPKGCIEMTDQLSSLGLPVPAVTKAEECTACGACAWLCPHLAIEVYKYKD